MRDKRILILCLMALALAVMSLGLLTACGSDDTDTTATTAGSTDTTAAASTDTTAPSTDTTASAGTDTTAAGSGTAGFDGELVIGALASMTGANAMTGAEQKWAQEKAVADINAKGGVNVGGKKLELKLKFVDDKSDATEGAAAIEKLIKVEGLKIILSTQVTPINLAAAIVAEKYQALYHMNVTWTSFVREQNFKWVTDIFFSPDKPAEVPFNLMDLQPEAERPKNWAILTEDNQDGQGLGEGVKAMAQKHGYNIALYETYTPGTKDYSSVILKMKQNDIDAIVTLVSPADGITFVKQMKEQNFAPKFMLGWKGFWPTEFQQGLQADSNYILHDGFWSEDLPAPGAKELGEAFKKDHNGNDSVSIGNPYAAVQVLVQAIEKAGSTEPAAVRDEIFGGTFPGTVLGDLTYDEQGLCETASLGLQWINGKRVIIWPDQGNKLEWFKPWDQR